MKAWGRTRYGAQEISLIDDFCLLHLTYLSDIFLELECVLGQASHLRKLQDPCMTMGCPQVQLMHVTAGPGSQAKGRARGPLWCRFTAHMQEFTHLSPSVRC